MAISVYCDAAYYSHKKYATYAAWFYDDTIARNIEICRYVKKNEMWYKNSTANHETYSIIMVLEELLKQNANNQEINIYTDNQESVSRIMYFFHFNLESANANERLHLEAANLMKKFSRIKVIWIPRTDNKPAHKLSTIAYELAHMKERARRISVVLVKYPIFLAASSDQNDFYAVDVQNDTCTCSFFKQVGQRYGRCKHLIAAHRVATKRTQLMAETIFDTLCKRGESNAYD